MRKGAKVDGMKLILETQKSLSLRKEIQKVYFQQAIAAKIIYKTGFVLKMENRFQTVNVQKNSFHCLSKFQMLIQYNLLQCLSICGVISFFVISK